MPAALKMIFFYKNRDYHTMIDILFNVANTARREGLLALETEAENIKDEFIKKGLIFIADNVEPEFLKKVLESEIEASNRKYEAAASVFEGMGGTAPTMGVLGTVMGMVSILRDMSNMDELGGKIATAFVATLYGVGSANLLWLPIAAHIKAIAAEESEYFETVIDGLLSIQAGEYPARIKESLYAQIGEDMKESPAKQKETEAK
jgi:chemotaxis protein MotA